MNKIRPFEVSDYPKMIDYFLDSPDEFLVGMGIERTKLFGREEWKQLLEEDHQKDLKERKFFYVAWMQDNEVVGHSNINLIEYGKQAKIHLHVWNSNKRKSGLGSFYMRESINFFLDKFKLAKIICEPNAKNPGPNKVMQKLGCTPIKTYETIPGPINYKQFVTRYEVTSKL